MVLLRMVLQLTVHRLYEDPRISDVTIKIKFGYRHHDLMANKAILSLGSPLLHGLFSTDPKVHWVEKPGYPVIGFNEDTKRTDINLGGVGKYNEFLAIKEMVRHLYGFQIPEKGQPTIIASIDLWTSLGAAGQTYQVASLTLMAQSRLYELLRSLSMEMLVKHTFKIYGGADGMERLIAATVLRENLASVMERDDCKKLFGAHPELAVAVVQEEMGSEAEKVADRLAEVLEEEPTLAVQLLAVLVKSSPVVESNKRRHLSED